MKRFLLAFAASAAVLSGLALAADSGSKADIAAVRSAQLKLAPNEQIAQVHVVGNYAMLHTFTKYETFNPVYKRISGESWKRIMLGAETSVSVSSMVQAGVPSSVARSLCSDWATPQLPHNTPCMGFP
jgi:hypothetical protein